MARQKDGDFSDENDRSRRDYGIPSPGIHIDIGALVRKNLPSRIMPKAALGEHFLAKFTANYNEIFNQYALRFDLDWVLYGWSPIVREAESNSILNFLTETGIPLAGATPPYLGVELLNANADDRENILLGSVDNVLEQCRSALDPQETGDHAGLFELANRALIAFEAGHIEAAQALATVALDRTVTAQVNEVLHENQLEPDDPDMSAKEYAAMVRVVLGKSHTHQKKSLWLKDRSKQLEDLDVRRFFTMPILTSAYTEFLADKEDSALPKNYSRHATVHSGKPKHFTKANALRALMTLVSLLWSWHPTRALETRAKDDHR